MSAVNIDNKFFMNGKSAYLNSLNDHVTLMNWVMAAKKQLCHHINKYKN